MDFWDRTCNLIPAPEPEPQIAPRPMFGQKSLLRLTMAAYPYSALNSSILSLDYLDYGTFPKLGDPNTDNPHSGGWSWQCPELQNCIPSTCASHCENVASHPKPFCCQVMSCVVSVSVKVLVHSTGGSSINVCQLYTQEDCRTYCEFEAGCSNLKP